MEILDLHGVKHHQVDETVRRFLNFAEIPCQIITGHSDEMKSLVEKTVREYGWYTSEKDSYNTGTLIVTERNRK